MRYIFKAIVGSQSYGTSIPTSDMDYKGVYMQGDDELLGFGYKEQVDHGKDECYYEVRRFLQLLESGNPTVLELLYSPPECILINEPEFEIIREVRDRFLTKKCMYSFGGYAVAQIKKARGLDKKMNWERDKVTRKGPMDFCYVVTPLGSRGLVDWLGYQSSFAARKQENYGVSAINHCKDLYFIYPSDGSLGYHGIVREDSNDLRLSSVPAEEGLNAIVMSYNKDGYMKHCKDYNQYQEWLEKRNTQRYVDSVEHGQKIDGKNMLHCRRLLDMCMEIAQEGKINVLRPNAAELLKIRRGEVVLNSIISKAEEDLLMLEDLYAKSSLPDSVDRKFVNELLLKVRHYGK